MIVNPLFFYLMDICNGVSIAAGTIMITVGIGLLFALINVVFNDSIWERAAEAFNSIFHKMIIVFVLSVVVFIFVPSESALLMMQAATLATADNVNAVFEALKSAIDYVVSVM